MAFEQVGIDPHLRDAKFLGGQARQVQHVGKFLVALSVGDSQIGGFAEALPPHQGREVGSGDLHKLPFRQENRRQRLQPRSADEGNRAIRSADALAQGEPALAPGDALGQTLVPIGDADLGKARVHIQEDAPSGPVVFSSPDPQRHRAHHEQIGLGAESQEFLEWRAGRAAIRTIDPTVAQSEWLQAFPDVSSRILKLEGPFVLVQVVNPGTTSAVFEIKDLMAERAEPEKVLETGPGLPAQAGATDRAGKNYFHSELFHNPALCIKLPSTLSAAKYSAAISRAARQCPS